MIMNNMKKLSAFAATAAVFLLPVVVLAADGTGLAGGLTGSDNAVGSFLGNILIFINTRIIPAILAIGFLLFVWGVFQYFIRSSDEAKETGKNLIVYSVVGFVLILSFWGIVNLVAGGIGLNSNANITTPKAGSI